MLGVNMDNIKARCMEAPTHRLEMVELATQQWLEEQHQDSKGLFKVRECCP